MAESELSEELFPTKYQAYTISGKIGEGSYGSVYHAYCMSKAEEVAIKVLTLNESQSKAARNKQWERIKKECLVAASLRHENLVRTLSAFCYGGWSWIVMPFMCCSCLDILRKSFPKGFENENWISKILHDVCHGLNYIHELNFVHRDIKAVSILMSKEGVAKISDFGELGSALRSLTTITGTPAWMAPEILDPETLTTSKSDIWSLGITALELIAGKPPHSDLTGKSTIKDILMKKTKIAIPEDLKAFVGRAVSSSFKEFVYSCVQENQEDRKSAAELLKLRFFENLMTSEEMAKALELTENVEDNIYIEIKEGESPNVDKNAEIDFKIVMGDEPKVSRQSGNTLKNILLEVTETMKEYEKGEEIEFVDNLDDWSPGVCSATHEENVLVSLDDGSLITVARSKVRRKLVKSKA